MAKLREYRPVDAEYLDRAPVRRTLRQELPASASATFRALEDAEAWPEWLDPITKVTWTSPKPFGVGTTRDIELGRAVISEFFFAWEDGRRMSFYFQRGQVPFFAAFAEDYLVEPTGADSCELIWRYGFECAGIFRLVQPIVAARFRGTGIKFLAQLAEFMKSKKATYEH